MANLRRMGVVGCALMLGESRWYSGGIMSCVAGFEADLFLRL